MRVDTSSDVSFLVDHDFPPWSVFANRDIKRPVRSLQKFVAFRPVLNLETNNVSRE